MKEKFYNKKIFKNIMTYVYSLAFILYLFASMKEMLSGDNIFNLAILYLCFSLEFLCFAISSRIYYLKHPINIPAAGLLVLIGIVLAILGVIFYNVL